ncbi:hypothetical protein [Streptomyces sp. G45]|uniref:hypothetical protein n=1 Tax=Streptomyces sp. G45 TaxID=3406627 RepID=UPI003C18684A
MPTASMRPAPSRTSTVLPSVSRAPHSSRAPDAAADSAGWGCCGWLSGIGLLGLGAAGGGSKRQGTRPGRVRHAARRGTRGG